MKVLQDTIKPLLLESVESGEPVSYQHPLAQRLCAVIEFILSFGLKGILNRFVYTTLVVCVWLIAFFTISLHREAR
jgi:hypothetical protein